MEKSSESSKHISTYFAIIGGGIAGVSCAEQLAIEDPFADIVLISASPLIKAVKNVKKLSERLEDFDVEEECHTTFENRFKNCKVILACAEEIKAKTHEIFLSNGVTVSYKVLCICSGAVPKVIDGNSPYITSLRDIESIQVFQKRLSDAKRVVVIGNGGIATELVYEIENCEVIWAIKDKSIGSTFFDAGAACFFLPSLKEIKQKYAVSLKRTKYKLEEGTKVDSNMGNSLGPDWSNELKMRGKQKDHRNVHVEYLCEVKAIYQKNEFTKTGLKEKVLGNAKDDWPVYVELTNGNIFGCNFIISATGVIPNSQNFKCDDEFLLAEDGGLMVDDQMKTSVKDIFAAGDVCTASWPLSKHWFQMRLWTQARQMGFYAGKCMIANLQREKALTDICFDLFTHVTKFFGYKVVLLGLFNGQKLGNDYELIIRSSERIEYVKVVMQDGRMQGAILIGETDLEETFENLILNQLDLSVYGEDILNPAVDIEDYFD